MRCTAVGRSPGRSAGGALKPTAVALPSIAGADNATEIVSVALSAPTKHVYTWLAPGCRVRDTSVLSGRAATAPMEGAALGVCDEVDVMEMEGVGEGVVDGVTPTRGVEVTLNPSGAICR